MIGQIIQKQTQPCDKSASCYISATGKLTHSSFCPIGRAEYRAMFNAQRRLDRENHKRFMAQAKANLEELSYLPNTVDKPVEKLGRIKI